MVGHEVEMDETYVTHCRKGRINVHESTVFRMRHKYLHFIEDMESDIYGRS